MTAPYSDPLNVGNRPGDGPLRRDGRSVAAPLQPETENNLPSTESEVVKKQKDALNVVRDLWEGARHVRSKKSVYLPMAPRERPSDYDARLKRAVFHEFYGDTVQGLTGMVFRKDPVLGDDVPLLIKGDAESGVEGHWENIDNAGTHGDVFAREIFQDALIAGHAAILVEFPKTEGRQTAADESSKVLPAAPIRPYWVHIRKDDIVSWRTTVEHGRTILTQLVIRECAMVPDGAFGEREQKRYRAFYRVAGVVGFRLYEVTEDKKVFVVDEGTYPTQAEIPVSEIKTSGRRSLFESRPPLIGLAELNLSHYRTFGDYHTSIHMTCVPIFTRIGFIPPIDANGQEVELGPHSGLDLPVNGDAKYVSHDGASLASVKEAMDDLVAHIASLGMSMLASQKRAAETATAKRIDKTATDSALAVSARGCQDGLERALYFHAKYLKLPSGGSITINRDFENLTLEPAQIQALSGLVRDGHLTIETLWKMLAEGNVLPEDFDEETEKAEIEAQAELKRQEAMELAQASGPPQPFGAKREPPISEAA